MALHILDIALLNAHALYLMQTEKGMPLPDFQMSVIRGLLEKHKERRISSRGGRCSSGEIPQRLTDRHFPDHVPSTASRKNAMRKCHVCTSSTTNPMKRKESRYMCSECDVGLCVVPCFKQFHTQKKF
jgi:hypothetical protein